MPKPESMNPHDVEARWRELALRAKKERGEPMDVDAIAFLRERDALRRKSANEE